MKTLTVFGCSDDLIEFSGIPGSDEFNIINDHRDNKNKTCPFVASFIITSPTEGSLKIHAVYDICWSFAVGQADDGIELPNWPVKLTQYSEYSTQLEIEVPDDTIMACLNFKEE